MIDAKIKAWREFRKNQYNRIHIIRIGDEYAKFAYLEGYVDGKVDVMNEIEINFRKAYVKIGLDILWALNHDKKDLRDLSLARQDELALQLSFFLDITVNDAKERLGLQK